ncbi:MAG: hypothetical protein U5K27_20255 [Desulfotignum sp.]|nr:hypothetical protein [Desulfotignum sp.]
MLDRSNLLDLIRTFTLFTTNDTGQTIKIVGRYQQFRAVKLAVKRLLAGKSPREAQRHHLAHPGVGQVTAPMMFMVREMYRHAASGQLEGRVCNRPHPAGGSTQ